MKHVTLIHSFFSLIQTSLVGLSIVLSAYYLPILPNQVPTHWNFRGEIDGYSPKLLGIFLLPFIQILLLLVFQFLPRIDPKKNNYQYFNREWHVIQISVIGFLSYIHFFILEAALNQNFNITKLILVGTGLLFVLLGVSLKNIRQNYFIGIRTPWTIASEHVWYKTHRFGSWCFVLGGLVIMIGSALSVRFSFLIFTTVLISAILPAIYSLFIFIKQEKLFHRLLALGVIITLVLLLIRLMSREDTWICQKGAWIQHGQPNTPAPTQPCPE